MVAPDDVRAVAEDEGIPIYVISTNEVNKDAISSGVFKRITARTGGKAYWAKTSQKQVEAFESIREDLGNSYTVTYYPQANPRGLPQDQRGAHFRHRDKVPRSRQARVPSADHVLVRGAGHGPAGSAAPWRDNRPAGETACPTQFRKPCKQARWGRRFRLPSARNPIFHTV